MKPELQRFKGLAGNDDLPVQDETIGLQAGKAGGKLGEEAVQRFLLLRLQVDAVAVAEGKAPEAVIFGLVEPALAGRQFVNRLGLHRLQREREEQRRLGFCHVSRRWRRSRW